MSAQFTQVTVTAAGSAPLVSAGDGDTLIYNTDAANTVWLSDDPFSQEADQYAGAPLPPGASVAVDGKRSIYGVTGAGTAAVTVIPGGRLFFQLVDLLVKSLLVAASKGNGVFVYSGAPGAGDLVASITGAAGDDPFGTAVPAGAQFGVPGSGTLQIDLAGDVLAAGADGFDVIRLNPTFQRFVVYADPG